MRGYDRQLALREKEANNWYYVGQRISGDD